MAELDRNISRRNIIRIVQLSDTHFLEPGVEAEGGFAYDTSEAFDAVFDHIAALPAQPDLIVVTGDIADHGRAAQYDRAADAFARFDVPVNVCPGNHDQDAAFTARVGRPGVGTSRVVHTDGWCHLFVDSNAGVMLESPSGRMVDPDEVGDRLHRNGALGEREMSWVRDMCANTNADHVFVWVHHPPSAPLKMVDDAAYAAEWDSLLADLPIIKGLGAGHTHIPDVYELHGRPVIVAPSLKHSFDIEARTWLPPGYIEYGFSPDGEITSQLHVTDDDRWPRRPLGRALMSLFNGEITHAQLAEIAARRLAERSS